MLRRFIGVMAVFIWFFRPATVCAIQTHGGLEGLFVHQIAHVFFTFSMGLLIYWLRKRGLVSRLSWRYIQYAAIFFIAWNLDAFFGHWLLEQSGLIVVEKMPGMQMRITTIEGFSWLVEIYYISKLDHLLCMPAMVFLLLGLRRLRKSTYYTHHDEEPAS